ncbi:helix-turn-helix domain-containing protein [Leuconostoc gasicomitatum]|uniref:helix-turn-helix domain-containing protein n=1 Tax=Leuconostoc gasicomitatum TaxID=115778 RepID=UPI001CC79DB4|nr:helix-turn-helix transcriptional regulator [Leuconostoc gasicomitatum]MBZ5969015.1 helix-turn-helix transcriptional regulator [Leuconostoc gasicomitatum]MBZ5998501.1 helix-turn-helix transcriptional regulator [Leuconostoc gasicomitatum]
MTIFERVKEISDLRKISLQALAEKSNMGINSIYGWKTKKPSIEKISAVADVLHVSTDYLLGRTDEPNHYMTETEKMLSGVDLSEAIDRSIPLTYGGHELDDNDKEIIRRLFEEK